MRLQPSARRMLFGTLVAVTLGMTASVSPLSSQQNWYSGIDAALDTTNAGKIYFFKGAQYLRFTGVRADEGYPVRMPGGWRGLPASWRSGIDAAVAFAPTQKVYLFKGNEYVRLTGTQVDPGYPLRLPGGWRGLPVAFHTGIDAALYYEPTRKMYLFKGSQYVRLTGVEVDPGYPLPLPGGWRDLPAAWHSGIDAAVFRAGHTYFFKGNQYVRFTGTQMDSNYPQALPGGWQFDR